jgi:dihydroorotate dehydrogenase (NAD+) catalytic subunit
VKLTPNVADPRVIARAVVEAGAHALCVGNTLQAMLVDVEGQKPVIGMTFAGLSGPALKPVNLRQVYQVAQAVEVPVIGWGGISTAADALVYLMAGAAGVQVGTATFANPLAPWRSGRHRGLLRDQVRAHLDVVAWLKRPAASAQA